MGSESVLVPSKFLLIIIEIIAAIVIIQTKEQNILNGISDNLTKDSQEYKNGNKSVTAAAVLTLILLFCELIIIFLRIYIIQQQIQYNIVSVSYTHLTLPTICSVLISVVCVSLKKKRSIIK
eukprot:TRINITY_DN37898_c0_g1_i1.p2 TRINITY_DN37898_c0_g1~~TRINITY_DN37898_c0_g1_i1.p2  ORF type:complete len:122 (-),score=14.42 TRINITY_DN37898_c0_g1_i1:36-401(-)